MHSLCGTHQRQNGKGDDRQAHAVQNVDFKKICDGTLGVTKKPQLESKRERDEKEIPGSVQCRTPSASRTLALAFPSVHPKRKRDAHKEKENCGRDATNKLRNDPG